MVDASAYSDFLYWQRPVYEPPRTAAREVPQEDHAGYSDFLFWRRPYDLHHSPTPQRGDATACCSSEPETSATATDYNEFLFRRRPVAPCEDSWTQAHTVAPCEENWAPGDVQPNVRYDSMPVATAPRLEGGEGEGEWPSSAAVESSPSRGARRLAEHRRANTPDPETEGEEEWSADEPGLEPDLAAMLQGGSGALLVSLLTGLSARLGSTSRFAAAANLLREDVAALRQEQHPATRAVEGLLAPPESAPLRDSQV